MNNEVDNPTPETQEAHGFDKTGNFTKFNLAVFSWCMSGVVVIYGVRLYHDAPIHPSFVPIIGAVFAAVLSFTLVITLRIVAGHISFKAGSISLEGASGPIIFWCVCFMSVCFGLYLLGFGDVDRAKIDTHYKSCSTDDVFFKKCKTSPYETKKIDSENQQENNKSDELSDKSEVKRGT